jgi:hypothetical protein
MTRRFEPGAILTLELSARSESPARQLLLRVKHATMSRARGWIVGCEFACPLCDDELKAILDADRPEATELASEAGSPPLTMQGVAVATSVEPTCEPS